MIENLSDFLSFDFILDDIPKILYDTSEVEFIGEKCRSDHLDKSE